MGTGQQGCPKCAQPHSHTADPAGGRSASLHPRSSNAPCLLTAAREWFLSRTESRLRSSGKPKVPPPTRHRRCMKPGPAPGRRTICLPGVCPEGLSPKLGRRALQAPRPAVVRRSTSLIVVPGPPWTPWSIVTGSILTLSSREGRSHPAHSRVGRKAYVCQTCSASLLPAQNERVPLTLLATGALADQRRRGSKSRSARRISYPLSRQGL